MGRHSVAMAAGDCLFTVNSAMSTTKQGTVSGDYRTDLHGCEHRDFTI